MNPFSVRQLSLGVVLGYLAGYAMTVAPGLLMAMIFLAWEQTLPIQALVGLGFPPNQADEAVVTLAQAHPTAGEAEIPLLLREGLALLGRNR